MDRRQFLTRSSMAAAAMALPFNRLLANKLMPGAFTRIRRNVGYFTERGGTIGWLAADEGFAIIDSQYPETAKNCLTGLQERTTHPLDLLINTHHHGDHTGGNSVFEGTANSWLLTKTYPR